MNSKRTFTVTLITCAVTVLGFFAVHLAGLLGNQTVRSSIRVGFLYDSDESTPYTQNFIRAQHALEQELGDSAEVLIKNNVSTAQEETACRALAEAGCDLIFVASYGDAIKKVAGEYPQIEFCQAGCSHANDKPFYPNYHTFMGAMYQGRYLSGVLAGMKMKEMLNDGVILQEQAIVGYVAAFETPEVISGYTAFLLGVRAQVPEAVMRVKYINTWSSYTIEKAAAKQLIDEGCVIISQHTDTIAPAAACADAQKRYPVYHVGYNQSMIDVAPSNSLISARINWIPYITGAAAAVMNGRKIEECVPGRVHGNDVGAGFEQGWIDMLELNTLIAAKGSKEAIEELTDGFCSGEIIVFKGDYTGTDPKDPNDKIDLHTPYYEHEKSSAPTFHYILDGVITTE